MKTTRSTLTNVSILSKQNQSVVKKKKEKEFVEPIRKNPFFHNPSKLNLQRKLTFSEKAKQKSTLKENNKDIFEEIDRIYIDMENGDIEWKERFCQKLVNVVNVNTLLPVALNEKGSLLFENINFWVLLIRMKEENMNLKLSEAISLFNEAYSHDLFDDEKMNEYLNNFFLKFVEKYSKKDIYDQLMKSKNKFKKPMTFNNVAKDHFKYLLNFPEYFVASDFERKMNPMTCGEETSFLYAPPSHYSKCSSLNNSMISSIPGEKFMFPAVPVFERISKETIYYHPNNILFSSNHSLNTSFIEKKPVMTKPKPKPKELKRFEASELLPSVEQTVEIKEKEGFIRSFEEGLQFERTGNVVFTEWRKTQNTAFSIESRVKVKEASFLCNKRKKAVEKNDSKLKKIVIFDENDEELTSVSIKKNSKHFDFDIVVDKRKIWAFTKFNF